jgi:surface carbohydrate biosynthesis protein
MAAGGLQRARAAGHAVVGWDEEGLVYPDPIWYMHNRIAEGTLDLLDHLVVWGDQSADDLLAAFPSLRCPVHALGNPRIDLLRDPAVALYRDEAEALRRDEGPFVLINTNFDLVNHADGQGALVERLEAGGRISGQADVDAYERWAVLRHAVMTAVRDGLPELVGALPGRSVVIRPHPSEDLRVWEEIAARLPGVVVRAPKDSVIPWILAADAMVHNSCTTAVEAHQLGCPVVAYSPPGAASEMESPLPNALSAQAADWGGVVSEVVRVIDRWDGPGSAQERVAGRHLASRSGELASSRIADLLEEVPTHGTERVAGPSLKDRVRARTRSRPKAQPQGAELAQRQPLLDQGQVAARLQRLSALLEVPIAARPGLDGTVVVSPAGSAA